MLHKNSKMIAWCSGKTWYAFDLNTGQRLAKHHENSTQHVVFYHHKAKKFCWMDCACYSYLYMYPVHKYDPESQVVELDTGSVEMPVLFDDIKKSLREELNEANSEEVKVNPGQEDESVEKKQKKRKRPSLNHLAIIMGTAK